MTTRISHHRSPPQRMNAHSPSEFPHPLSNDLVPAGELGTALPAVPEPIPDHPTLKPEDADAPAVTRTERKVGRTFLLFAAGAVVIGLILAATLFPRPELFIIGAVGAAAFALFLMAPVILAETTRVAQDEAVKSSSPADAVSSARHDADN